MDPMTGRKDAETWPNPGMRRFLDFTLDSRRQLLLRGAESIRLRGRTYDVLSYLVMHAGRLVSKQELMESVWGDVAVTDDSLVQCLMEIRRALGDSHDVVKTIRGRGYLFDATVRLVAEDAVQTPGPEPSPPDAGDSVSRGDQGAPFDTPGRFRTTLVAGSLLGVGIAAIVAVSTRPTHSCVLGRTDKADTLPGRAATGEPVWRCRTGILCRWNNRRAHRESDENQSAAGDLTNVSHAIQGHAEVGRRDRARA